MNKGHEEFHSISDALSTGNYEILEIFSLISLDKLRAKNEKRKVCYIFYLNNNTNYNVEKNKNIIEKIN